MLSVLETPLTQVTSVCRPHGADAGEEPLLQEVVQNPDVGDYVTSNEVAGRRLIRRALDDQDDEF